MLIVLFPADEKKGTTFFVPFNSISGNHTGDFKAFYFGSRGITTCGLLVKKRKLRLGSLRKLFLSDTVFGGGYHAIQVMYVVASTAT